MTISTCTICNEPIHFEPAHCGCEQDGCDPGWVWIHEHGEQNCGAGDGSFAMPSTTLANVETAAELANLPSGTLVQVRGPRQEMWWYQKRGDKWEGGYAQPLALMVAEFGKLTFEAMVPA